MCIILSKKKFSFDMALIIKEKDMHIFLPFI